MGATTGLGEITFKGVATGFGANSFGATGFGVEIGAKGAGFGVAEAAG